MGVRAARWGVGYGVGGGGFGFSRVFKVFSLR